MVFIHYICNCSTLVLHANHCLQFWWLWRLDLHLIWFSLGVKHVVLSARGILCLSHCLTLQPLLFSWYSSLILRIGPLGFSCCTCGIVPAAPFRLLSKAGSFGLEGGVLLSNSYYGTSFHIFFFCLCHFSADSSVDVLLWISCSCRSYLSLVGWYYLSGLLLQRIGQGSISLEYSFNEIIVPNHLY